MPRLRTRGNALLEAAFALPLLILLLGGVVDAGRALGLSTTLAGAARAGAQVVILHPERFRTALDENAIAEAARIDAGLSQVKVTAQRLCTCSELNASGFDTGNEVDTPCESACPNRRVYVRVTVRAPQERLVPLSGLALPATLESSVIARVE